MEAKNIERQFATAVILNEDASQVLLILRQDFRIWGLPGGNIEPGESPEQAAIREAKEETGYDISLDRLAGIYLRPQMKDKRHVYRGRVIGGQALSSGPETLEVRWFPVQNLPEQTTPFLTEIVQDTLEESKDVLWEVQRFPWTLVILLRFRIWLRDVKNKLAGRP